MIALAICKVTMYLWFEKNTLVIKVLVLLGIAYTFLLHYTFTNKYLVNSYRNFVNIKFIISQVLYTLCIIVITAVTADAGGHIFS